MTKTVFHISFNIFSLLKYFTAYVICTTFSSFLYCKGKSGARVKRGAKIYSF